MSSDKRICATCVSDAYLKAEIAKSSTLDQDCDYCESIGPTIDMATLADRCDTVIENFYEVSSLSDAVIIYERTPEGEYLAGVLDRIVSPQQEVVADLVELLTDMWFEFDSQEHHYGEEPWFVEKTKTAEPLSNAWNEMERSLKHEARYLNPKTARMLENMFGALHDDRTSESKGVVMELGADCEINTLYRARVFQTLEAMETALRHPERHIGSPPSGVGVAGRMNAKGVSVFYGATEKEIAISEVRPPVGCHVVVGAFKPIRTLRLLDLHQLGSITLKPTSSPFDPATAGEAARCAFMETLTQKMVMPVMPELEEQGYLITQAIADFLSTHPKLVLDGIIFPSAQNTTVHKDAPGRNVVLFNKASMVLNADADYGADHVELWEYDEDSPRSWFKPEVWLSQREGTRNTSMWLIPDPIKPALELDLDSIDIYEIEGVRYQKTGHQVKRHIVQPKIIKNDRPADF
ncbi:RES domain-containing protein [Candidatus Nitrotoga sp. M5]|uniref:RES domain-containing protein n=1 Tax=Candidatus Nitrotoga sp. M5 TaxID=2890409 RepID=UPI001EF4AE2C|nr:RES domain-containing protein [Candidatus Nitrotoga sp. M5]CAH1387925.1 RES domain-containing protein [Candidatus Nitrotoga sp. M5]